MAELVTIARPYAEAVFRLAREQNSLAGWSDALSNLGAIMNDARMQAIIGDPNVGAQQLENLILDMIGDRLEAGIAREARNFVQVLARNARLELTPHIRTLYEALKREQEGVLEVRVISALPVSDDQAKALNAALEAKYRRRIITRIEVDPQLIGGVKIVVGDKVIDATVRSRLDAMATTLTH